MALPSTIASDLSPRVRAVYPREATASETVKAAAAPPAKVNTSSTALYPDRGEQPKVAVMVTE